MKSGISVIQQRKTRSDLYFKTSESAPNVRLVVEYFESCWWSEILRGVNFAAVFRYLETSLVWIKL